MIKELHVSKNSSKNNFRKIFLYNSRKVEQFVPLFLFLKFKLNNNFILQNICFRNYNSIDILFSRINIITL